MRCRDTERWATAYVDGELDERRASALRGHLRTCAACLARIEDEAAVRGAAEQLEPALEPPPTLWAGIEARLAEAEVADSRRSRAWWWWQGARRHAWTGAAALAVVALAVVWTARHEPGAVPPSGGESLTATRAAEPSALPTMSFAEQRLDEISRADARYQQTVAELRAIVAEERAAWSADYARAFDARVAELDDAVARARAQAAGSAEPAERDGLASAYRQQIAFLSEAAVEGDAW